ncbi:MAG: cardiolipin synthase B [Verrucomicrobia bacterium]|nr:cardiolipin synthase B [Verrucomicrobiota bacterium]
MGSLLFLTDLLTGHEPKAARTAAFRLVQRIRKFFVPGLATLALLTGCTNFHGRGIQYQLQPQYGVDEAQFLRSMGQLVGPEIVGGNRVTSLVNGDQIFPAMLEAIRSARKTINLESYIYWSGEVGRRFTDALTERARSGVRVHVLLDWVGSRRIDSELLRRMRAAGVDVQKYNPLVWYNLARVNHRDHRKLLIVDGTVGFIGGAGVADIWLGNADSPAHWRDTHFRLEGPAVGQMQAAFMDNWMKTTANVLDGLDYFPDLLPVGDHFAQVIKSSPREGTESVRLMYLISIAAARKSIRLSMPYFVPGALTTQQLLDARKRGVAVEIIVPGARTDTPIVRHASRSKWGPLLEAGVKIYEYQPTMYHCKMMIVDDFWVSVGSANFDSRSFRLNDESNLNVLSSDFAAEQVRLFEHDKRQSREVAYQDWKRRSVGKRLLEFLTAPFHSHL